MVWFGLLVVGCIDLWIVLLLCGFAVFVAVLVGGCLVRFVGFG